MDRLEHFCRQGQKNGERRHPILTFHRDFNRCTWVILLL